MKRPTFPIAVLDLETDGKQKWSKLQTANVVLVGLLVAQSVNRLSYRTFQDQPEDYKTLAQILTDFPGTILTYNGLRFDFLVLKERLPVRKFLEKTFDLFYWVYTKLDKRKGTKLDDLSRENLRLKKIGTWKSAYVAWKT